MKINNIFKFVFLILIIIFIFLIIASKSGYYEYELSNKTKLTEEAIERFENDIANGKDIDINNYIDTNSKNYDNKFSKLGNKVSNTIESVFSDGFSYLFKYLSKQMNE